MTDGQRSVRRERAIRVAGLAGLAALVLATLASPANRAIASPVPVPSLASGAVPTYQWPEFHNTSNLNGVTADPTITSTNAPTLGVKWMSPIGGSLASPVVAYNTALGETLAYVGTSAGYFDAVNAATGQIVW